MSRGFDLRPLRLYKKVCGQSSPNGVFPETFARLRSAPIRQLSSERGINGSGQRHEREAACDMASLNHRIEAGLIPGSGHIAQMQQPIIYNLAVQAFWDRVSGGAPE